MDIKKISFRKLLYNRRFTIPLSIIAAFIFWLVITINQKPDMDRTFSKLNVTINLENTLAATNEMSIIGDISKQEFTVVVRGPSYLVSSLTASDMNLYASAATVDEPGEYELEVSASTGGISSDYQIISITPSTVNVTFDYIETKEFSIVPTAVGAVAEVGLIAENSVVSGTESDTITVKGPRSVINKIETVTAVAEVNKTLSASDTFDAKIVLYDAKGNEISQENLIFSTSNVKVTVPISKKKVVPVKVEYSNLPSGFNTASLTASVDYASVTVIGTPATVEKITSVSLSPIDITAVSTDSSSFDVAAKLPEGVKLLDSIDHFTVTVDTSKYTEKIITVSSVKYTNLESGLKTQGSSSIKNVKICGPKEVIDKLDISKIYAEINLTDKKTGEHTVTAVIKFEGYNNIWAVGTYSTTVTLK